jgi:lipopolysaccharide/colanic/teichoic acid biosynthesis glycosyltransferase
MIKRIFDIVFSLLGLVVLSPFFVVLTILIKAESKGNIFYLQTRVGKNNKDFKIFKFRSMYQDADKNGLLTIGEKDSRVTRVGYYIRKYKLDEFAQLINVLKGEMSIVGPRPEVRKYVEMYNADQKRILLVKPGITDYASIEFSNENEILEQSQNPEKKYIEEIMPYKLNLGMKYINHNNTLIDFKIIFLTLKKIFL